MIHVLSPRRLRLVFTACQVFTWAITGLLVAPASRGMSVVPPTFSELVNKSDYVVRTVVKSVTSAWREKQGQRHIYTLVTLEVREVVSGTPPSPLVLELLGGELDGQAMVIVDAPLFKVGEEDILFVRGNGRQFYPLTAVMHGRYPILRDAATGKEYMARSNRVPLAHTAEVGLPMTEEKQSQQQEMNSIEQALTPAAFIQQIRAAVGPTNAHNRAN